MDELTFNTYGQAKKVAQQKKMCVVRLQMDRCGQGGFSFESVALVSPELADEFSRLANDFRERANNEFAARAATPPAPSTPQA